MTEQPRAAVTEDLDGLQTALASAIPARTASNLLVGTWNIRALGDLTAIARLGAVISRFDVVAVQESRRNPAALRRRLASLGPGWRVIISDVTEGAAGLVGEIVLHPDRGVSAATVRPHTPYTASFTRAGVEFILASVQILWGKNPAERLPEITAFAEWMHDWAVRPNDWNSNLIVLGDFNLGRIGDPLNEAVISAGLWPPTELNAVPRTIFDDERPRTSTTSSPGSPSPTARPCCRACPMASGPERSTLSRTSSRG